MMNKANQIRKYVAVGIGCLALLATACSTDMDNGTTLPPGEYPITFTTQVEGLTATRATTGNSWAGGEDVAIRIDGTVKKYKAASGGALSADDTSNPFYWTNSTMTVSAWYAPTYSATKPTSFSVVADQSSTDYQTSDFLYVSSQSITFSKTTPPSLTFKHLPVKVVVNLKKGDGITETEVQSATVTLVNQNLTSGAIADNWTVTQATTGSNSITPNVLASAAGDYQKSVQALLVPQQMQDKQFIKVTVGTGDATRDYFYTPTNASDANLEAGKQHTYNITVKKTGLEVTAGTSASWTDETSSGSAQAATFNISVTGSASVIAGGSGTISGNSGNYTLSGSNEFTVKITAQSGKFLKDISVKGVCELKSATYASGNYEYTYATKGDVSLTIGDFVNKATPAVGDYYYSDGTWSSGSAAMWEKPCIGIVFIVGAGNDDNTNNYSGKSFIDNQINGYVVALTATTTEKDSRGDRRVWGTNIGSVSITTDNSKCYGYRNTEAIKNATNYSDGTTFWACYSAVNYSPAAPSCSSGWYLPSLGELNVLWTNYATVQGKLTSTSGATDMKRNWGFYWAASKNASNASQAVSVDFGAWSTTNSFTDKLKVGETAYVRPVLTF